VRAQLFLGGLTVPVCAALAVGSPILRCKIWDEPRFCDWAKQARCKAWEVQVYAHTANLPQRSRLPVFDNPEGFENRLLFLFRYGFDISVQKLGNCIAFKLVCAQHDTNTCQFSNAKSGMKVAHQFGE